VIRLIHRPYKPHDENEIIKLLNEAFEGWHDIDFWRWKYKEVEGIHGKPSFIRLIEHQGLIIAHFAAIPVRMKLINPYFAYIGVDAATMKAFRRRGFVENLVKQITTDVEQHEDNILISFPEFGGPSYKCFIKKLQWIDLFHIVRFFKIINWRKLIRKIKIASNDKTEVELSKATKKLDFFLLFARLIKSTIITLLKKTFFRDNYNVKVIPIQLFDIETDELWNEIFSSFKVAIDKKLSYMKWRFSSIPGIKYNNFVLRQKNRIQGYAVTRQQYMDIKIGPFILKKIKIGFIVELATKRNKDLNIALIRDIERSLKGSEVEMVQTAQIKNGYMSDVLKEMGYLQFPSLLKETALVASSKAISMELYEALRKLDPSEIFLSLGDWDLL
jgi:hypothetical protein